MRHNVPPLLFGRIGNNGLLFFIAQYLVLRSLIYPFGMFIVGNVPNKIYQFHTFGHGHGYYVVSGYGHGFVFLAYGKIGPLPMGFKCKHFCQMAVG